MFDNQFGNENRNLAVGMFVLHPENMLDEGHQDKTEWRVYEDELWWGATCLS